MGIPMAIVSRPSWEKAISVSSCIRLTLLMVGTVFMLAKIHTQCTSRKHGTRSLLYAAHSFHGSVEPDQEASHRAFICAVEAVNCGFEFPGIGVISMDVLAPLARITMAVMPIVLGAGIPFFMRL